ncbi:MAG: hypothetical protein F4Y86_10675 [Gammaproteobacteria bacterium]|nr:hypothetical protein [Gammaproteobacteria bacterium]MXY52971.1 hypothetical protein [Gammaproteobacteria bacterium]MYB38267.1 hypothetical protein [Gammaproteobacteria bacterium]MYE23890.1 hypothetical protein [Gammaproteobacteria bacterium]
MPALVLSLGSAVILGGGLWLLIGARLNLNPDATQNDILNVFAYIAALLPICFALVFFVLGSL